MQQEALFFKSGSGSVDEQKLTYLFEYMKAGGELEYEELPLLNTDQDIDITDVFGQQPFETHIPGIREAAKKAGTPCKVYHVRSTNGYDLTRLINFAEHHHFGEDEKKREMLRGFAMYPLTQNNNQPPTQNI